MSYSILRESLRDLYDPQEVEQLVLSCKEVTYPSHLRQTLSPYVPSLESLTTEDYIRVHNHKVFISKTMKLITALRIILSLIREEEEDLSWIDIIAIYEIVLRIEESLMLEPGFVKKYGTTLKVITNFLIETGIAPKHPERFLRPFRILLQALPEQFFIKSRNLSTELLKMREKVFLVEIKPSGTKLKYLPPKAFIGKGYGDKGARRKPEQDASPTWQEVAVSTLPRDLKREYKEYLRNV